MKKIFLISTVVLVVGIIIGLVTPRALNRHRVSKQLKEAEAMVSRDNKNPLQHWILGNTRFVAGDRSGAMEAYHHALELDPNYVWAHKSIGEIYLINQQYDEATLWLNKALVLAKENSPEEVPSLKQLLTYVEEYRK